MGGLLSKFRRGGQREAGGSPHREEATLSRTHQSEPQLIDEPPEGAYSTDTLRSTKSEGGLLRGKKHGKRSKASSSSTLDRSNERLEPTADIEKGGVSGGGGSSSSKSSTLDKSSKSASLGKGGTLRGLFRSKSSTLKSTRSGAGSKDSLDKKSKNQQREPSSSEDVQGNFFTRLFRRSSREFRKKHKEQRDQRSKSEEKQLLTPPNGSEEQSADQHQHQHQDGDDNLFKLRSSSEEPQLKPSTPPSETPLLDTLRQDAVSQNADNPDIIQERGHALRQALSRSQELILEHQEKRKQFLMTKTITTTTTTSTKVKTGDEDLPISHRKEETSLVSKRISTEDTDSTEDVIFEKKKGEGVTRKTETEAQDIRLEDSYEIIDGPEIPAGEQVGSELKADLERLQWEAQKIRGSDEALKPISEDFEVLQVRQSEVFTEADSVMDNTQTEPFDDAHKSVTQPELSREVDDCLPNISSIEKIDHTELFISEGVSSDEKMDKHIITNVEAAMQEPLWHPPETNTEPPDLPCEGHIKPIGITTEACSPEQLSQQQGTFEDGELLIIHEKKDASGEESKAGPSELNDLELVSDLLEAEGEKTKLESDVMSDLRTELSHVEPTQTSAVTVTQTDLCSDTREKDTCIVITSNYLETPEEGKFLILESQKSEENTAIISKEDSVLVASDNLNLDQQYTLEGEMKAQLDGAVTRGFEKIKAETASKNEEQLNGRSTQFEVQMPKQIGTENLSPSEDKQYSEIMEQEKAISSITESVRTELEQTMVDEAEITMGSTVATEAIPQSAEDEIKFEQPQIQQENAVFPVCQSVNSELENIVGVVELSDDQPSQTADAPVDETKEVKETKPDLEKTPSPVCLSSVEAGESQEVIIKQDLVDISELTEGQQVLNTEADNHLSPIVKPEIQMEPILQEEQFQSIAAESSSEIQIEGSVNEYTAKPEENTLNLEELSTPMSTYSVAGAVDSQENEIKQKILDETEIIEDQLMPNTEVISKSEVQAAEVLKEEQSHSIAPKSSSEFQMEGNVTDLLPNTRENKEDLEEPSTSVGIPSIEALDSQDENLKLGTFDTTNVIQDQSEQHVEDHISPITESEQLIEAPVKDEQSGSFPLDSLTEPSWTQSSETQNVGETSEDEVSEDTTAMLQQVVSDAYSAAIDELKTTIVHEEQQVTAEVCHISQTIAASNNETEGVQLTETGNDVSEAMQECQTDDVMQPSPDISQAIISDEWSHNEEFQLLSEKEVDIEGTSSTLMEHDSEGQLETSIPMASLLPADTSLNSEELLSKGDVSELPTYQEAITSEMAKSETGFEESTAETCPVENLNMENQQTVSQAPEEPTGPITVSEEDAKEIPLDHTSPTEQQFGTNDVTEVVPVTVAETLERNTDLTDLISAEMQEDDMIQETPHQAVIEQDDATNQESKYAELLADSSSKEEVNDSDNYSCDVGSNVFNVSKSGDTDISVEMRSDTENTEMLHQRGKVHGHKTLSFETNVSKGYEKRSATGDSLTQEMCTCVADNIDELSGSQIAQSDYQLSDGDISLHSKDSSLERVKAHMETQVANEESVLVENGTEIRSRTGLRKFHMKNRSKEDISSEPSKDWLQEEHQKTLTSEAQSSNEVNNEQNNVEYIPDPAKCDFVSNIVQSEAPTNALRFQIEPSLSYGEQTQGKPITQKSEKKAEPIPDYISQTQDNIGKEWDLSVEQRSFNNEHQAELMMADQSLPDRNIMKEDTNKEIVAGPTIGKMSNNNMSKEGDSRSVPSCEEVIGSDFQQIMISGVINKSDIWLFPEDIKSELNERENNSPEKENISVQWSKYPESGTEYEVKEIIKQTTVLSVNEESDAIAQAISEAINDIHVEAAVVEPIASSITEMEKVTTEVSEGQVDDHSVLGTKAVISGVTDSDVTEKAIEITIENEEQVEVERDEIVEISEEDKEMPDNVKEEIGGVVGQETDEKEKEVCQGIEEKVIDDVETSIKSDSAEEDEHREQIEIEDSMGKDDEPITVSREEAVDVERREEPVSDRVSEMEIDIKTEGYPSIEETVSESEKREELGTAELTDSDTDEVMRKESITEIAVTRITTEIVETDKMPEGGDAPLEQLVESVRSGEQPESEITEMSKETDSRPLPEQTESESDVRDVIEHETKPLESTDSKELEEVAEPEGVTGDESEVVLESKEPTVDRSKEFLHVTEMKSDIIIPSDVHLSEDETERSETVIGHEIALSEETSHDESEKVPEEEVKEEEIEVICKESVERVEEADIVAEAVTSGWKEVDVFEHEINSLLLTSTNGKDSEEVVGLHQATEMKLEKCKEGEIICELDETSYKTEEELRDRITEVKPFKESTVHRSTEIHDIMASSACINQSEEYFSRTGEACDSEPHGENNGDQSKLFDVNEEMVQNRTVESVASSTSSIYSSDSDSAASFTFENPLDIAQTLHPANQPNQALWDTHETYSTSSVSTELDRRSERPSELSVMSPECDITEQVIVQSPRSTTMVTVSPDSITIECMFNSKQSDSTLSSMTREDQLPLGMSREQTSFHRLFSDRNREGCVQSNDESSAGTSTKWDHSVHTYKLHTSDSDRVSLPLKSDVEEAVSISMQGYVATERQEAFIKRTKIIATISIQPVNSKGINLLLAKYEHTVPTTGEIIAFEQSLNKNFSDCHETKTTVISSEEEYHATFSNEQCTLSMIGQDSGLGLSQVMGSSWETDLSAGVMTPKETAAISEGAFQTASCTDEEFQQEKHSAESSSSVTHEFIWEHGGQDVYLCGSFNNWMPIPLSMSDSVFKIALQVPEGKHYYRYIVDEETTVNPNQVIEGDLNCVELKKID